MFYKEFLLFEPLFTPVKFKLVIKITLNENENDSYFDFGSIIDENDSQMQQIK